MNQNNFSNLPKINSPYRYENFLNVYQNDDGTYFYNLLRNITVLPADNTSIEDTYTTKFNDTWYLISHNYYGTMDLWWLVCEYNQITNPTIMPQVGTKLKLLKSQYVSPVLQQLNLQNNN
jgi:LysM repeat protein